MLGLSGWYSTNILGNRDGEVLDDPDNFKTKEESKLGVLEHILQPERYPELYGDIFHKVRINYYPPRGDNKEGWDNIDIFGWLGYPMQIKVDFLCRDSILAAPLALDLVLFTDLAQRAGLGGIQEWLELLLQEPDGGARPARRARPVHPAHQAEEHAALDDGRGPDHPPRPRVLRRRPVDERARPGPELGAGSAGADATAELAASTGQAAPVGAGRASRRAGPASVSIIIPARDRGDALPAMLDSVSRHDPAPHDGHRVDDESTANRDVRRQGGAQSATQRGADRVARTAVGMPHRRPGGVRHTCVRRRRTWLARGRRSPGVAACRSPSTALDAAPSGRSRRTSGLVDVAQRVSVLTHEATIAARTQAATDRASVQPHDGFEDSRASAVMALVQAEIARGVTPGDAGIGTPSSRSDASPATARRVVRTRTSRRRWSTGRRRTWPRGALSARRSPSRNRRMGRRARHGDPAGAATALRRWLQRRGPTPAAATARRRRRRRPPALAAAADRLLPPAGPQSPSRVRPARLPGDVCRSSRPAGAAARHRLARTTQLAVAGRA